MICQTLLLFLHCFLIVSSSSALLVNEENTTSSSSAALSISSVVTTSAVPTITPTDHFSGHTTTPTTSPTSEVTPLGSLGVDWWFFTTFDLTLLSTLSLCTSSDDREYIVDGVEYSLEHVMPVAEERLMNVEIRNVEDIGRIKENTITSAFTEETLISLQNNDDGDKLYGCVVHVDIWTADTSVAADVDAVANKAQNDPTLFVIPLNDYGFPSIIAANISAMSSTTSDPPPYLQEIDLERHPDRILFIIFGTIVTFGIAVYIISAMRKWCSRDDKFTYVAPSEARTGPFSVLFNRNVITTSYAKYDECEHEIELGEGPAITDMTAENGR